MLAIGVPALRIISVSFCFAGVAIVFSSVFQALGDAACSSLVMSAVRQLLLLLPCAFVLAKLGGLDAVWFSFLIAEVAYLVTLAVVFYRGPCTTKRSVISEKRTRPPWEQRRPCFFIALHSKAIRSG